MLKPVRFMVSLLFSLVLAPLCQAATTFTWDNESGNNEWTTPSNWVNNAGLPTLGDTAVFNDLMTGLCRIQTNAHVLAVVITNRLGFVELEIPSGYTLKAGYQQSYGTRSTNQVLMRGGGSFAPTGSVFVSYAGTGGGYNESVLTVSNLSFETEQLGNLYIGANADRFGAISGKLDSANASILWKGNPGMLVAKGAINLGMNLGRGEWWLPPTLTNLTVQGSTLCLGGFRALGQSTIQLGENPALQTICSSNSMQFNNAYFVYTQGGNTVTGLPSQVELIIGSPEKSGSFFYGYTYNSPCNMKLANFKSFRAWLSVLYIGKNDNSNTIFSELDLSETSVSNLEGSITAGSVNIPVIAIGGTKGDATGILKLPSTITNITCNSFELGNVIALSAPPNSVVHLGTNRQPIVFSISNNLVLGFAQFQTVNALGITNNAFPAGSKIRIGTPQSRATVVLGGSKVQGTTGLFGKGFDDISLYASNVTIGVGAAANNYHYYTNDFRDATNFTWDVEGGLSIGENLADLMYVWFPRGSVTCSNFSIGQADSATYNYRSILYLSNTVLTVKNAATVKEVGVITNFVSGYSSGLDIGTLLLDLQDPGISTNPAYRDYGRMDIRFVSDPVNEFNTYWGLRLKGDARSLIQDLVTTNSTYVYQRLTWTTNGLSAKAQTRFGVHYDSYRNMTYVGVKPLVSGTLILVR